jgi:hypothetical protein
MKFTGALIGFLFMLFFITTNHPVNAQERPDKYLQQMVDSVNHLLKTSPDGYVQFLLSVSMNGDASLLDSKQSGFRFNLLQLKKGTIEDNDAGIEFVPENIGSITTNKWIRFHTEKKVVANIKFTATNEELVKKIHGILLRIRSFVFDNAGS